jgi:hypothetical protein
MRVLQVCSTFAGISPSTIYDVEYRIWLALALTSDENARRLEEQAKTAGRR